MSSNIAIEVERLSKCYNIYSHPKDRLKQAFLPQLRRLAGYEPASYCREFWALKDVSFQVKKGEVMGIIGRNGSGKSTLLQMISGTLEPTTGSVITHGRVAALLELGAGFNPEFTGRENVFLNAMVLGLSQEEIEERFDRILAFADIGEFIEQPVKQYSSGMYARLAFAVAINVDPDILVVDEALAVGDEPFQRKCFARIEKIRNDGGTILFVSHFGGAVVTLCDRAILLHRGSQLYTGIPKRAVFFSQKLGNTRDDDNSAAILEIQNANIEDSKIEFCTETKDLKIDKFETPTFVPAPTKNTDKEFFDNFIKSESMHSYEENGARIFNFCLTTIEDVSVNQIFRGRRYKLKCEVQFEQNCYAVRAYALIRTTNGIDLAGCAYPQLGSIGFNAEEGSRLVIEFPFTCSLNPAIYFCNFALQGEDGSLHHRVVDAIAFKVMSDIDSTATGIVDLNFSPSIHVSEEMRETISA